MSRCARLLGPIMAMATLAALGGCSKEITIWQFPPFWTPELKSIAVLPFRSEDKNSGQILAEELANTLRHNETYKVFTPGDVKEFARVQDLQIAFGDDQVAMAAQVRKLKSLNVQALITGRVTTYTTTTRDEQKADPIMVWDNNSKQMVPTGQYNYYTVTRNEAVVAATAALIGMDGTTIYATGSPAQSQQWAQGSPPPYDRFACRQLAVTAVVQQLLEHFAIVQKKMKIDPAKTFRLASGFYDGKWDAKTCFHCGDPKMLVVLSLPPECDRNRFRITVVREGAREDLASTEVLWSNKFPQQGKEFAFSAAEIAAKGGGPGRYTAKLYSGMEAEPVILLPFTLEP